REKWRGFSERPSFCPAPWRWSAGAAGRCSPATCRGFSRDPLLVDGAHGIDGIGVLGPLVRAIALHAREAQREAARVLRALLDVAELDLDHQLGAQLHDPVVAAGLASEELARLPFEHRVGHALEGLAEHDEAARGIAR